MLWKEEYSVGIDALDEQHKEIINLINILRRGIDEHEEKKALNYATQKLLEYTLFHFSSEETLFKEFDYPETASHKVEHSFFIQKVSDFKKKFDSGESIEVGLEGFLTGWLSHHIMEVDHKYAKFFKRRGINSSYSIPQNFDV